MISIRRLTQILAPTSLVLLAACQTTQTKPDAATDTSQTPAQSQTAVTSPTAPATSTPEQQQPVQQQGAPVGVFLADTTSRANWTAVEVQSNSMLYVNPEPVLNNDDLIGVQAGTGENPEIGLLALDLNPEATARLAKITTENPNMRLALVVGNTMLAAPGYSQPVTEGRLIFMVGSEANALAAAQAIAGENAQPVNTGGARQ